MIKRHAKRLETLRAVLAVLAWRARQKAGATLAEYTFIVSIVSIAGVVLLIAIGQRVNALLEMTNNNMPK